MVGTRTLLEVLKDLRAKLEGTAPAEPVARAKQRMDDAAKRGGLDGMLKDTLKRIDATTDSDKLAGIVSYVDDLVSELEQIKKAAMKKTKD